MTAHSMLSSQQSGRHRLNVLGFGVDTRALFAVMVAFLVTRLVLFSLIFLSSTVIPVQTGSGFLYADPDNLLIDGLVRHDSWWYHNIVTTGYDIGDIATGRQGNVAFFPLYPLLIKMVMPLTGNPFTAGLLVSNAAFLVALAYLYALTQREFDRDTAARAVFYYAAAPAAVFFSAMYTESVYMALVIATFYYARESQWSRAALAGALAAATRNTGIFLAAVVALEGMHQAGFRFLPHQWWQSLSLKDYFGSNIRAIGKSWRALLAAFCVPLGMAAYMFYLNRTFGDPLAFIHVQETWGRDVSPSGFLNIVGQTIVDLNFGRNILVGQFNPVVLLDLVATVIFGVLIVGLARNMRPAYLIFVLLTFLVPLSTGTVGSMARYVLMLFPCFILLAKWGQRSWIDRVVLGISLPFMAYSAILFSHWYFVG